LKGEFIAEEVVNIPTPAFPVGALFVGWLDGKPIKISSFINLYVLDEGLKLLHDV
jgi:hypothetical protein